MPKNGLPGREKEICQRVREAREARGFTQQACANLTGIQRSTLANYEALITPLGYDEAKRICYHLNINQRWLALGLPPQRPCFDLSPNLEFKIKPNSLFSKAFDEILKGAIQEQNESLAELIGQEAFLDGNYDDAVLNNLHLAGEDPGIAAGFYVQKVLSMKFQWMPEQFRPIFAARLMDAEEKFWKAHGAEIKRLIRERQSRDVVPSPQSIAKKSSEINLTFPSTSEKMSAVKDQWPELKRKIQKATSTPGGKTALAQFLGVDITQLSKWLTDSKSAREPGAEYALRMLKWVKQ